MPMVIKKHFDNPFPDYSPESSKGVIKNANIDPNNKVVISLKDKWESALHKFNFTDNSDNTVYTGTAGVGLLLLLEQPKDKAKLLEIKRLLMLSHLKRKRATFLCGDAGPLAIGAVVSYQLKDFEESKRLIEDVLNLQKPVISQKSDIPNEYMYGRVGYLFALLYLNKHISPPPIGEPLIRHVVEAIFNAGLLEAQTKKSRSPLLYQWHDSYYLGAAHGISGIIYMLLQAKKYVTESELNNLIKPTIDFLTIQRYPSGNFPSSLGSETDRHVQWCHGAPGFVYMYSEAFKVFGDRKYLNLALDAANVVWERGLLQKGYSICHGVSGNAYCFLELFQTTKDPKHLYRAVRFAEWCVDYTRDHEQHQPDRPLSLFEGIAGPMYLLMDIQKPLEAKFPGFTL